jgi:hypothetical protein
MTKQEVINRLLPKAQELKRTFGLHVSMTLAQIVRESGWLQHAPGNNFLGIKAPVDKYGNVLPNIPKDRIQLLWTTEYISGKWEKVQRWFMNYASLEDCMDRYAKILLLPRYKQTLNSKDFWDSTNYVRLNGYASSPVYTDSLRTDILSNKLYQYDWYHKPKDSIETDFTWDETYSSVRFKGKTYYRIIEPYPNLWDKVFKLAHLLQDIRSAANSPLKINRWFSIPEYNAYLGGVGDSQHLVGLAADCAKPKTWTMQQFFGYVDTTEATGIGVGRAYLHIDARNDVKRIWYY